MKNRLLFVVNDPGFFASHRLPVALAAKQAGFEVHVGTGSGEGVATILANGLVHHSLPLTRSGRNPFAELKLFLALVRLFRLTNPKIVHLVTVKPVLYGGVAARLVGVPGVVAAISGLGFVFIQSGWRTKLLRGLIGTLYRIALGHKNLRVIFQNPDDMRRVSTMAALREDQAILIRGSGVDLARFARTSLPPGAPTVVLPARLLVDKGVREFVQAARLLRERGSRARFILVGSVDPGNPASLEQRDVDDWVVQGAVEWLGQRSDMPQVLSMAHIVVLPSYREGLPKVLLEAAACGRAVVTTDVPGCRDAITPGVTGLLVPSRDAVALANALDNLINDPVRCESMGREGRALADTAFDVRAVAAAHVRIYRELIERA